MKKLCFQLVTAWVAVMAAASANVVVCIAPTGEARMQLAGHECCSACSDPACAACAVSKQNSGCFLHSDECCQDLVFPFPPAPVVKVFQPRITAEFAVLNYATDHYQNHSKIPHSDSLGDWGQLAVSTAVLRI